MMKKILFLTTILTTMLYGCSNAYKEHFSGTDQYGWSQPVQYQETSVEDPQIISCPNTSEALIYRWMEQGYYFLGNSLFQGNDAFSSDLRSFAKEIKADLVAINKEFLKVNQRLEPFTRHELVGYSSYHDHKGRRVMVPNYTLVTDYYYTNYNIYAHHATFWKKGHGFGAGIFLREMSIDERQKAKSNFGAVVLTTVRGSAAFQANLLPGDLIIKCNQQSVQSIGQLQEMLRQTGSYTLTIIRDEETMDLVIKF